MLKENNKGGKEVLKEKSKGEKLVLGEKKQSRRTKKRQGRG